jgi:hypothetical protein
MNNVFPQTNAASYIVSGSLKFTEKKERFLYKTVSKTKRQDSSSGGSSGMSSTISKHSGGGRKY